MIRTLLIANRGEIACRIIRTARRLGIETVAVYSAADARALHVELADRAVAIGPAPASDSYLRGEAIIAAARDSGADAIHPGYGFLSENAAFAEACLAAGLVFVGPPASAIRAMGLKDEAKALMQKAKVPVVPGFHGHRQEPDFLREKAYEIGYPVLIKAVAGGGGKGMRRVDRALDFDDALAGAKREAKAAFGDDRVLIEKYVTKPRHVEIQIFGDCHGNVVHLYERDCSLQRRHQKVIEEAPAPGITAGLRARMGEAAVTAALAVGYQGAGTVEFIVDGSRPLADDTPFYFMEMNTRLQVEHPVTEEITGLDLVEWQIRVASGEPLPMTQHEIPLDGHAVEARLYAEDPQHGFLPSTGTLHALELAGGEGVRIDTGVREGDTVTPFYDPMIAKVIAHGATRDEALDRLSAALAASIVAGPKSNIGFLRRLADDRDFRAGRFDTGMIDRKLDQLIAAAPGARQAAIALGTIRLVEREVERIERDRLLRSDERYSPWSVCDGFQLGTVRAVSTPILVDGVPESVDLEWADGEPAVRMTDPAPDGEFEVDLVDFEDGVCVLADGIQTTVCFRDPFALDLDTGDGDAVIRAPMHGKVISVHVAAGDRVEKGAKLAVIEAMKMEHTLVAGRDGTVTEVSTAAGEQVGEGQKLITIHAD
ncbi:3-methylcrotonyl-CoA carboxylase alpha subunit [Tepidamorphus gemmatus]|uniref:3-methylcrotonyl-CoA carboxylase alpha subunit n=1 Tax=Tepidamorphus gemmatus TaxID=747076 RepID=A0A4R3MJY7_9HYPH|nr:acetyl/propionyl/methylcrotonyl-CoA carboxylase subunit alpha [Tepidamorphus gemmatus]TCT12744.1 3-methylcrotonyl-CoA carboxylase alpha subunit [Tepidamorphus gemmatus]